MVERIQSLLLDQFGFSVGNLFLVEELAEILHHRIVRFEALGRMVIDHIALGEVEERVMLQQRVLEPVGLGAAES